LPPFFRRLAFVGGEGARDSILIASPQDAVGWGQRYFRVQAALQRGILEPIGNVKQKQAFAEKVPITLACCLSNTRPKTLWHRGFRAVPLLRV
jgi:hypothetical protein